MSASTRLPMPEVSESARFMMKSDWVSIRLSTEPKAAAADVAAAPFRKLLEGTVVLGEELGRGAFGVVYLGHLLEGDKGAVAVKRSPAGLDIRREASLLAKLSRSASSAW